MILIKKNPEPREWLEYRSTPGVDYQSIPELVDSLLEEQENELKESMCNDEN